MPPLRSRILKIKNNRRYPFPKMSARPSPKELQVLKLSSLFERTPIGWDWNTIEYLYNWAVGLPLQLPEFIQQIMEQSRVGSPSSWTELQINGCRRDRSLRACNKD